MTAERVRALLSTERSTGVATRWRFTEITPRSFHWLGDALGPDGATWQLEGEFLATRIS